ncbi:hypothetical protein [Streptomyces sp. NPDC051001]
MLDVRGWEEFTSAVQVVLDSAGHGAAPQQRLPRLLVVTTVDGR